MKECVVYHWWAREGDQPPPHNLRIPIISSIATLRACNPNIPIYVLDGSDGVVDYGDLPAKLGFETIRIEFYLKDYLDAKGCKVLSRIFDIRECHKIIKEDVIIYADSDVFWLKDPLPLKGDGSRFSFNGYNNGFFYYDKTKISPKFFELYEAFTRTALNDEAFRYITWQYAKQSDDYFVLDEALLCYMWHKHLMYFDIIDVNEHCTLSSISPKHLDLSKVKMLHANGISVQNRLRSLPWQRNYARGLLPLVIKELYKNMTSVIPVHEIYTQEEVDCYVPLQVSMFDPDFQRILLDSINQEDLLDLMASINLFHQHRVGAGSS